MPEVDDDPFGPYEPLPVRKGLGVLCESCRDEEARFRWDNGKASCYGCGYGDAGWGDDYLREIGYIP